MTTLSTQNANLLRKKAVDATKQNTKSVLILAEVLWNTFRYNVKFNGIESSLWVAWGYKTWFEYVEHELGIHQSTAAAFRRIHEIFQIELEGSFDKELFDQLSATKLRALCKVVNKKNVNSWLRRAAKMSCCALDESILVAQNGGIRANSTHTLAILCTKTEQKKMRDIITEAKELMGLERPGATLLRVLQEWNNSRVASELRHTKRTERAIPAEQIN